MRNLITIVGFTIVAILLYIIWGSLNSKLVAIESNTGSYIDTKNEDPNIDFGELLEKLAMLETAQSANTKAITTIIQRLDELEIKGCGEATCAGKLVIRETIYFEHDDSQLSEAGMRKIDKMLDKMGKDSMVSLRGHADTSGDNRYNQLLSLQRAAAVKGYINKKLSADKMSNNRVISISGTGEESVVNATDDGVEDGTNRIVEILIFE